MDKISEYNCLPENYEVCSRATKEFEAQRAQIKELHKKGFWNLKSENNYTNDPVFLERFDPFGTEKKPYRAVAGYISYLLDIYVLAKSSVKKFGRVSNYALDEMPRWYNRYKVDIGVWEGAQHGSAPTFNDVPAQDYYQTRPKNVFTERMELPTDAVELGNILTGPTLDELLGQARDEIDIKQNTDIWTLLNASAVVAFGTNLVRQIHPSVTAPTVTGNDYDWRTGQANPAGGTWTAAQAGFSLAKMQELVNMTAGMLGGDGKPLRIKRIVVPAGAAVRRSIQGWPGSASTAGGVPEGILEEIWRGMWLYNPPQTEGTDAVTGIMIEEDATIGTNYVYVFTDEPAFEFAYWPDAYQEFQHQPDYHHPDYYGFFIKIKYREYMPVPRLWNWARIRMW